DLLADRQAVDARQHDVEHDQVGLELAEAGQGLGAVAHRFDLVSLAAQVELGQLQDVALVVDHEHSVAGRARHATKKSTNCDPDVSRCAWNCKRWGEAGLALSRAPRKAGRGKPRPYECSAVFG